MRRTLCRAATIVLAGGGTLAEAGQFPPRARRASAVSMAVERNCVRNRHGGRTVNLRSNSRGTLVPQIPPPQQPPSASSGIELPRGANHQGMSEVAQFGHRTASNSTGNQS